MITADILCLGNELLLGRTVNTNATIISLELSKIGIVVNSHIVVRDEIEQIVETLKSLNQKNFDILVISGGLGITHDDIQLECISKALNIPILQNEDAYEMLLEKLDIRNRELNDDLLKFALTPQHSTVLRNSVGMAPGILTRVGKQLWFSLPGVPSEMQAILKEELIPLVKSEFPDAILTEMGFTAYMTEPEFISSYEAIKSKFPLALYKSHPKHNSGKYWLEIHVYGYGEEVVDDVLKASKALNKHIQDRNYTVTSVKTILDQDFEPEYFNN